MATNYGKRFEEDFFKSFSPHVDISIDRVYDNQSGFKGVNTFCDFMVYSFPYKYYFELKSYEGVRIPLSAIRDNQFQGLLNKAYIRGITAGVIFQFRLDDFSVFSYFIDIREINRLRGEGKKSITLTECSELGVPLISQLKRTRFTYLVDTFLAEINSRREIDG